MIAGAMEWEEKKGKQLRIIPTFFRTRPVASQFRTGYREREQSKPGKQAVAVTRRESG